MSRLLRFLRTINAAIGRVCMGLAIAIVGLMVTALAASAFTRYITGIGYDWLIELPPMMIPWLVFPLLGPLLKSGAHISVDAGPALMTPPAKRYLRMATSLVVFAAALVFLIAGYDAVMLFRRLGQVVELEVEFPIWYIYSAFPVGFAILASFGLELFLTDLLGQTADDAAHEVSS